jgi:hypothetical protein
MLRVETHDSASSLSLKLEGAKIGNRIAPRGPLSLCRGRKMCKRLYLTVLLLLVSSSVWAQEVPQYEAFVGGSYAWQRPLRCSSPKTSESSVATTLSSEL